VFIPITYNLNTQMLFSNKFFIKTLFSLLLFLFFIFCSGFNSLTRDNSKGFPRARECQKCHQEIFDEWQSSAHAHSFTNPRYRDATDGYEFLRCISCHAPQPSLTGDRPGPRELDQSEGVTCVACHLEEGRLAGPLDPWLWEFILPHKVTVDPERYTSSSFCGRCHEGTFAEWQAAEMDGEKHSCQTCHMPPVERKSTQASNILAKIPVALEKVTAQKRHLFPRIPLTLPEDAFTLKVEKINNSKVAVMLKNHLPHNVPTGDFGVRIVKARIFGGDDHGGETLLFEEELIKELKSALTPGSIKRWELKLPGDIRRLTVRVLRVGADPGIEEALFEAEVILP
jgi:hypothetical protein